MFRPIWVHSGSFGCLTKLGAKRPSQCKSSCHEVASDFFATNALDPPPLDPKLTFWCVSYYLGAFGTVSLPYETRFKTGRTSKSSCHEVASDFFANERSRSSPLDPKLTFWCVSYYLGAFETVWMPYETWCKTGRTSAKVSATRSHRNYSQRTHPIHPIGP